MKYNAIARMNKFEDEGKIWINFSFVSPDHQEHELMIEAKDFVGMKWQSNFVRFAAKR